jgi:hypothetical protein
MRKGVLTGALAFVFAAALAAAQAPAANQDQTQTQPQQASPAADRTGPTITLEGCLYKERDVPGREPNVAERAGIMEDYILADAAASGSGSAPSAGKMYKVEKIADDQLSNLVGKRVEVTGRIDEDSDTTTGTSGEAVPKPDTGFGPDKIELPEFEATSIKAASGTCPAKPSGQ